jgi:phenylacetic acid degradation operon negative regulatory protein
MLVRSITSMPSPQPRQLILNLLLAAEHHELSARAAVAACALFGIRDNSVRVALVRLAAAGLVESAERGSYRLGARGAALAAEVGGWRSAEERVRPWSGQLVAVHVAGLARSDRPALRTRTRAFALLGLRELERDLFVRPDNLVGGVASVRERLHRLGVEDQALVFLAAELDPAREKKARRLWDGRALGKLYRQKREKLERWLARSHALDLDARARESFLLGDDAIRQWVFDPFLPEPLVDVAERRAFGAAVRRFDDVGHQIWRQLLDQHGAAERSPAPLH